MNFDKLTVLYVLTFRERPVFTYCLKMARPWPVRVLSKGAPSGQTGRWPHVRDHWRFQHVLVVTVSSRDSQRAFKAENRGR